MSCPLLLHGSITANNNQGGNEERVVSNWEYNFFGAIYIENLTKHAIDVFDCIVPTCSLTDYKIII